jgi:hypothetical protein
MPDDPFEASVVYAELRAPWRALNDAIGTTGVVSVAKADEMEVRAKVQRRPRKPRLVTPPTGEAA